MDKTCWSGLVAGIVEGGVGGTGARAAYGVGRGVCFGRPLGLIGQVVLVFGLSFVATKPNWAAGQPAHLGVRVKG